MMANLRMGLALLATLSLLPAAAAAQAQQPQPSSQQKEKEKPKPKAKAKKVWSEDDVKELRKPGDEVEEPKKEEGEKGPSAAAKEGEAKPAGGATSGADAAENDLPKTYEEATKLLDAKFIEVREQQQLVAELQRQLYDSSSDQTREEMQARIAKARAKLLEAQMEHKKISDHRDELKAKDAAKPAENKPAEEKPPQQ